MPPETSELVLTEPGAIGPCHVGPDALLGIKRQQTNPTRWNGQRWHPFAAALRDGGIELRENIAACGTFATDAGGTAYGLPHGVVIARSAAQVSALLKAAQQFRVPVTVRGGGLTTEGESVAFGGVLLDMTGMSRVLHVDTEALTVRTEGGIFWHSLAEELRRAGANMKDPVVVINADNSATHQSVIRVMDAARRAGCAVLGAERFLDALAGAPAVGNEDEDAEERPRDKRGNPRRPSKKARAAARALRRLRSP